MSRAIIVEPDESVRRLQRMILRQHAGADDIVERTCLRDALPVYASDHFDFAMVDISRQDGALEEFLRISRRKQKSPVIAFTTGPVSRDVLQMLAGDHVFAIFPKPFELDQIVASVKSAIDASATGTLYPKLFGFLQKSSGANE